MLYRNYKKRLEKIAQIIDFIKKRKVSILIGIGTLFALICAFVSVRGIITATIKLSSPEIIYGQEVSAEADALFRNVSYQHKLEGESEWQSGLPEKVGEYLVRGCARRAFGIMNYTEEVILTIKPKRVEISPSTKAITYGQKPLAVASLNDGDEICQDEIEYFYEKMAGNVDFAVVYESIKIINENGENVTFCYQIKINEKSVIVKKKQATLTVNSAKKVYDGQALSSQEYNIKGLVYDDEIDIAFSATQTNVGSIYNTPDYKILSASGEDVTSNYEISKDIGKLTVSKRPVTIKVKDREEIYDATEYTCNDYEIILGDLVEGHRVGEFTFAGARTNVGSKRVEFDKLVIVDASENDVSNNYQITRNYGQLTIIPRQITVDAQSQKVYDAKVCSATTSDDNATLSQGSLVGGHQLVVSTVSDGAGEYDKLGVICTILDGESSVTENYSVTLDNVLMVIDRRDVVFTAQSDCKIYDATPLRNSDYTKYNLVEGHKETATVTGEITNVGVVDNVVSCTLIKNGEEDVTKNYNITCEKGTLEITKRSVRVWAEVEKTYDDTIVIPQGTLTMYVFKVEDDGTETAGLYGEQKISAEFKIDGENTDAGRFDERIVIDNEITIENGNLENYEITCEKGELVVNKRVIIITTQTGSKVYNGQGQTYEFASVENLVEWHSIKYKDWLTLTNVDEPVNNTVAVDKIYSNGNELNDKTANYEFEEFFVWGKYNIDPRPLISEIELTKVYDDQKYVGSVDNSDFENGTQEANKLVEGHWIEVDTGIYVDVDAYSITNTKLNYVILNGSEDVTRNYDLTNFDIKASITKRDITIYAPNATKTYDATAYEKEHNNLVVDNLVENHIATATVYGLYQDVRDDNCLMIRESTLCITRLNGEDVIHNYNVLDYIDGELVINKRPIKIWAEVEKTYDDTIVIPQGTLTMYVFKVEDDGTETAGLYGEQKAIAEFMIDGENTDAGSFSQRIIVVNNHVTIENGLLENYEITCEKGQLLVNKRKIIITTQTSQTGDRIYNGEAQTFAHASVENLVSWHDIKYKDWLTLINVDEPVNNTVAVDKIYSNGNELDDKTANYEFEEFFVWGKFSITPRPLLGLIELSKTYDDQIYSGNVENGLFPSEILDKNKLVTGQYIQVNTGTEVDAGTYSITNSKLYYVIFSGEENATRNYNLTEFDIKASITKRDITIYAPNVTKTYDAQTYEKVHNDLIVDNLVNSHVVTATVYGKYASIKAENYTALDISSIKITRENGTEVTANYNEPNCINGQMTINKRALTVRIDCEKVYDDTAVFSQSNQQVCVQMLSDSGVLENIDFIDGKAILYAGQELKLSLIINQGYECIDAGFYAGAISSEYTIMLDGEIADSDAISYVNNYDITVLSGDATINKRAITLVMEGKSKPYDRTALTNNVIYVKDGGLGLVSGHSVVVSGELPSIDCVGKIDNDIPFAIKKGEIDKTHNYDTSVREIGELEITKTVLKVRIYTRKKTYTGEAQQFDVMTVKVVEGLLAGDIVNGYTDWRADGMVVSGNAIKNVGSYQISTTPVIAVSPNDKYYSNCTDYYEIQIISGTFEISRCKLTIKTSDIEKAEAILPDDIQDAYNISGGKIPTGESVSAMLSGSQLQKGSSKNKVDYIVVNGESFAVNGDGKYECGNYEITIIEGTLTYK